MKIFEKKCPNCSANLEFKVGERDVKCPNCRRTFAVEYDQDKFIDPEVQLKAKDIQLKLMDDYLKARSFSKVFIVIVAVLMVGMLVFGVTMAIKAEKESDQRRQEIIEEQKAQEEEWKKRAEDWGKSQEEWDQEFQEEYGSTKDMIDNMREEMESQSGQ